MKEEEFAKTTRRWDEHLQIVLAADARPGGQKNICLSFLSRKELSSGNPVSYCGSKANTLVSLVRTLGWWDQNWAFYLHHLHQWAFSISQWPHSCSKKLPWSLPASSQMWYKCVTMSSVGEKWRSVVLSVYIHEHTKKWLQNGLLMMG